MEVKPGYKQTEVGVIPEDWDIVDAGRIGRFRGGNGFPTAYQGVTSGEYPFFKVSDMNIEGNETFMEASNNYISEGTRRRLGANAFPPHTIVFAKVGAAIFLDIAMQGIAAGRSAFRVSQYDLRTHSGPVQTFEIGKNARV